MRLLLIFATVMSMACLASAQCDPPAEYTNAAVVTENGLKCTLASDKSNYEVGETIQFYFVVENTAASEFSINWGVDPQNGLFAMPSECTALTDECVDNAVFVFPQFLYMYSAGTTLSPGECRAWVNTWDTNVFLAPAGTYTVLGGMLEPLFDAFEVVFRVPTSAVPLTVTIGSTTPLDAYTWGRIKSLYQ